MAVSKSILDMLADPPSPIRELRLEFFTKRGRAYVKVIVVSSSGFTFTDVESVDKPTIVWLFEEQVNG